MTFEQVPADAYDRFMGRYSRPLAEAMVQLVEATPGQRVLDVGCGPGALTGPLVAQCGVAGVAAADPSPSFVAAMQERFPGLDVRRAGAEELPFDDDAFDLTLAQLVVHFMTDPVAGLREMARVTRPDGLVGASVWDFGTGRAPLSAFWEEARASDPGAPGESDRAGAREGGLADLASRAGLREVTETELTVRVGFASFDQWWAPYLLQVGPVGSYVAGLEQETLADLERRLRDRFPDGGFEQSVTAWVVLARP